MSPMLRRSDGGSMLRFLKKWLSSSKAAARRRRERRPKSFWPALESLEGRQLLSACPVVNTLVKEDFVLYQDHTLRKIDHNFFDWKLPVDANVVSVTAGTDASGGGMAAYVRVDPSTPNPPPTFDPTRDHCIAMVWTDTNGPMNLWNPSFGITNNVKAVAAGQGGIVFVLTTSNHLAEFDTAHQQWTDISYNVASVSAGVGQVVSLGTASYSTIAEFVKTDGTAWEYRRVSGLGFLAHDYLSPLSNANLGITANVKSVSLAPTGVSFVLLTSSVLFDYDPSSNSWHNLGGNMASVSAGTDANGDAMATAIDLNGLAWEFDTRLGYYQHLYYPGCFTTLTYNPLTQTWTWPTPKTVVSLSASSQGVTDVVLNDGSLYQYNDATHQWNLLDTGVA
jgi:hypothetical protein